MMRTAVGMCRNGHVELVETPHDVADETQVVVTFLTPGSIDLSSRGIDESEAAIVRSQLASFAEEWESSEMDAYDNYDAATATLSAR
jgi:hypothetical protein